jgi:dTDP-4-dehydrorhamnose 3,5-epimerase
MGRRGAGVIFRELELPGAFTIDLEPRQDERGFFARAFCQHEFAAQGLKTEMVQANLSQNVSRGTLRGMHFQRAPFAEVKVVRCVHGAIYDVIIDIRPESPTFRKWVGLELTRANRRALYVPEGFAHGYQALEDDTEVMYLVTQFYTPGHESAIRWNDPQFGVRWPISNPILSPKDAIHPDYTP